MNPQTIRPVILCGGEGKSLWPVSRKSMPKQFASFGSDRTLLQETIVRLEDAGCSTPLFLTNEEYRFIVEEQATALGIAAPQIIIEPIARNTGPAICAAAEILAKKDPDALMLITPSDHRMDNELEFASTIALAAEKARDDQIVILGATPTNANTDYGYILCKADEEADIQRFENFVGKPRGSATASSANDDDYLWNTGILMASVSRIRKAFVDVAPALVAPVAKAVQESKPDMGFCRLGPSYASADCISVDHAVLEKSYGWVAILKSRWLDLSNWENVWADMSHTETGVGTYGSAREVACENSLLYSGSEGVEVVGIGLKNIAAIATKDAVLIADLNASDSVSVMVEQMSLENLPQATEFARHARPWGHYETLSLGKRFQVKSIVVKPGGKLSLQSHVHRAEHWVVVEGTATVTIGMTQDLIGENQSVYIPLGEIHRLENKGKVPLQLIEVQTGAYLGEDDIVRYEDVYERA